MGPWGPGLIKRFRPDIPRKFEHVFTDTDVVSSYIYHLNARNPSGETAFSTLTLPIGWASNPLIERIHDLREDIPISFLYGSNTWMDDEAGAEITKKMNTHKVRATYHIIPNAGHHIYVDNFEHFNQLVITAIQKHSMLPKKIDPLENLELN